jgi:hypothetical protein
VKIIPKSTTNLLQSEKERNISEIYRKSTTNEKREVQCVATDDREVGGRTTLTATQSSTSLYLSTRHTTSYYLYLYLLIWIRNYMFCPCLTLTHNGVQKRGRVRNVQTDPQGIPTYYISTLHTTACCILPPSFSMSMYMPSNI